MDIPLTGASASLPLVFFPYSIPRLQPHFAPDYASTSDMAIFSGVMGSSRCHTPVAR